MTYAEAEIYINSFSNLKAKKGLDRIRHLVSSLKIDMNKVNYIHVAGTNGKGSVSTMIAGVMTASGLKTGLYTSPHLVCIRERIQIDGEMISENDFAELTERLIPVVNEMTEKPTVFDMLTAVALMYFVQSNCFAAVMECGLGGAYDSTNIINPVLGVLVSLSLDHMGLLGDTVEKIAREKCGIIKRGMPLVCYPFEKSVHVFNPIPPEAQSVITEETKKRGGRLIVSNSNAVEYAQSSLEGTKLFIDGKELTTELSGEHQKANMLTAYTALKVLSERFDEITDESMAQGFSASHIGGRLEKVSDEPTVILDAGHNFDCAKALGAYVKGVLGARRCNALIGMLADKECESVFSEIGGLFEEVTVTNVRSSRAMNEERLKKTAEDHCKKVYAVKDPLTAFSFARDRLPENGVLVVFGSFYLVGEIKENFFS